MSSTEKCPAEKPGWVYMLRCAGGVLYTGWTPDLAHRLNAHCTGRGAKFTRAFKVEGLAYAELWPDKSSALRREAALKKLPKAQKEALVEAFSAGKAPGSEAAAGYEQAVALGLLNREPEKDAGMKEKEV